MEVHLSDELDCLSDDERKELIGQLTSRIPSHTERVTLTITREKDGASTNTAVTIRASVPDKPGIVVRRVALLVREAIEQALSRAALSITRERERRRVGWRTVRRQYARGLG